MSIGSSDSSSSTRSGIPCRWVPPRSTSFVPTLLSAIGSVPRPKTRLFVLSSYYRQVLEVEPGRVEGVIRAKRSRRLPVVLTRSEVQAILSALDGTPLLVCLLLYGAGLRLLEGLRLRVKDLDFVRGEILVRDGKGQKDWVTMLPVLAAPPG